MLKYLIILCAICVGCGEQIAVRVQTGKPPIYYESDGRIISTDDYLLDESYGSKAWAYVVEPSFVGRGHLKYLFSSWWDDSTTACLALKSRYEKQAKELEEKMKGVCK